MLKNYIITAWRNLLRNKLFSIINIGGLSIGIAACVLIYLYVQDELSYDRHWEDAHRIVKINWEESTDGVPNPYGETPYPAGPMWLKDLPQVEGYTRIVPRNNLTVSYEDKYFNEDNNYVVDSTFLSIFNYGLLYGDPQTCLLEPNTVVLSENLSKKLFGNANPLGKVLQYPRGPYKVTGVLKNTIKKSILRPTALLRLDYENEPIQYKNALTWLPVYTFLKLKQANMVEGFDTKLRAWKKKVIDPILKKGNLGYSVELKSELVSDAHFDNYFKDDFEKADKNYVVIFGWVAVFLLLIACFNFINLSTARAARRLKEVGVRKATGASRKQLIVQFLGESFIVSFMAFCIGLLLLSAFIPAFNGLTGKNIPLATLFSGKALCIAVSILTFISLIGGIYPALYLSGFKPINILKGSLLQGAQWKRSPLISLRQILVVSQFTISGVVIICTILVHNQLKMMKAKDLGFNKDQVFVCKFPKLDSLNRTRAAAFKSALLTNPQVKGVATARQLFSSSGNTLFTHRYGGKTGQASVNWGLVDENYLKLLDIKLVEGRNFSKDFGDKECYVINESALKFMNLKDPLNTELCWDGEHFGRIVGVIKDFNYYSPHTKIDPLVLKYTELGNHAFVKLTSQNITPGIDFVNKRWKEFFPTNPISYFFLDEKFDEEFYRNEDVMLMLLTSFSALTVLISCLGLFGLAAFVTEQRIKEIAIRKVVGASVSNIVYHISRNFLLLVVVAGILASPIAWYFIHKWLEDFAYRINVNIWIFIASTFSTMLIAFLTMGSRTLRAANSNPAKSLRTE